MKSKNTFKGLGVFLAMLLCCGFAFAQPANDQCINSDDLDCGDVIQGTTTAATFDNVGFCGTSNTGPGVWYNIPGSGGAITLSTCNQAAYDTKISVFSGSCGALTCVGGQDDATGCSGFTTEFTFLSSAALDYYVLVHGFGTASGSFTLSATCAGAPTGNDACTGALPLACGGTVSGNTSGATVDFVPFCGTSNTAPGVWYEITPPAGSTLTLSTCSANTTYDTKLSVFTDGCGTLTCVDGNDDDFDCPNSIFQSSVTVCADGSTYLVLVHGFGSATGDFDLSATCGPGLTNDDACDAEALTLGTATAFNNDCASAQTGEITPGAGTGTSTCNSNDGWCSFETAIASSVWFTFVAPPGGAVSVETDGFDTQLAVYSAGDCADFTTYSVLGANDDGGNGLASLVDLACLEPGATYYVQVDGFGTSTGNGTVTVTDAGLAPLEAEAGDCQAIFTGYAPAENDTSYLVGSASGGAAPYEYAWSGPGILYTDGASAAVLPTMVGINTYTLTVTDGNGCTTTDTVNVEVIDVQAPCASTSSSGSGSGSGSFDDDFDGSSSTSGSCSQPKVKIAVCLVSKSCSASASGSGSYDFDDLEVLPSSSSSEEMECFKDKCIQYDPCSSRDKVAKALAKDPRNHLGPCSIDDCYLNDNAAFDPPPAPVALNINILTDNFGTETSWEVAENGVVIASGPSTFYASNTAVTESFSVDPRNCYDVTIFDSFGDGICCNFGLGNWSVDFDGVNTASPTGGAFGNSETIQVGANCKTSSVSDNALSMEDVRMVAYPNPFSDMATFKFILNETEEVTLEVFDMSGSRTAVLFDGIADGGQSYIRELNGAQLENGLYIYRLVGANGTFKTGKIVLNK